jgi:hypothetical protein
MHTRGAPERAFECKEHEGAPHAAAGRDDDHKFPGSRRVISGRPPRGAVQESCMEVCQTGKPQVKSSLPGPLGTHGPRR